MRRTPGPWSYGIGNSCHDIYDANGAKIAKVYQNLADRFYIVPACNHFEEVVKALE